MCRSKRNSGLDMSYFCTKWIPTDKAKVTNVTAVLYIHSL